jgi:hypothetical protein
MTSASIARSLNRTAKKQNATCPVHAGRGAAVRHSRKSKGVKQDTIGRNKENRQCGAFSAEDTTVEQVSCPST